MGPPFGVVPDPVAVALEPHSARIQGRQGFLGFRSTLLSNGILEISRAGGRLRRCTSRHCSRVRRRLQVSCVRRRARHLISWRLCWRWASKSATRFLLRACPTATELPSMLWAVAVKRPMEGSILRAGKGGWGDFEGGGGRAPLGVSGGGSAGSGEPGPCPQRGPNHRWLVVGLSAIGPGQVGVRCLSCEAPSSGKRPYPLGIEPLDRGGTPVCGRPYWGWVCPAGPPDGRR